MIVNRTVHRVCVCDAERAVCLHQFLSELHVQRLLRPAPRSLAATATHWQCPNQETIYLKKINCLPNVCDTERS